MKINATQTSSVEFIATLYSTCLGSFGYVDPGFQGIVEPTNKCVALPWGAAHMVFWVHSPGTSNPKRYVKISTLDTRLGP